MKCEDDTKPEDKTIAAQVRRRIGGGIRGGQVHGASDKHAAYPVDGAVDPVDVHATIYHLMGVDSRATILDPRQQRPLAVCTGNVIRAIL